MLKEKKLYSVLLVLLVFSLIGEQPNLKGDLKRAGDHIVRTLQVNEVIAGWQSLVDNAGNLYRGVGSRLRASADVIETANDADIHADIHAEINGEIDNRPADQHYKKVLKKLEKSTQKCPMRGKGKCC